MLESWIWLGLLYSVYVGEVNPVNILDFREMRRDVEL